MYSAKTTLLSISPVLLAALEEAFQEASMLVPLTIRSAFVLVGGAAMLYHGTTRRTEDLDVVGTAEALWAFLEGARTDERFSVMMDGAFVVYHPPVGPAAGLAVQIDLLCLGDEAVPELNFAPVAFGSVFVAALPDLWRQKAQSHVAGGRDEVRSDLEDFQWISDRMEVVGLGYDALDLFIELGSTLGWDQRI